MIYDLRFKKNRMGFTLIELLIVISIIGILSAIGLVLYSTVLKQSRDSKRQSDLKSIQLALEQYNNDQGFYPAASSSPFPFASPLTNQTGNPASPAPSPKTYMKTVPNDSNSSTPYVYTASYIAPSASPVACNNLSTECNNFCLSAALENPPSPLPSAPPGCSYPVGYNFAVTPP